MQQDDITYPINDIAVVAILWLWVSLICPNAAFAFYTGHGAEVNQGPKTITQSKSEAIDFTGDSQKRAGVHHSSPDSEPISPTSFHFFTPQADGFDKLLFYTSSAVNRGAHFIQRPLTGCRILTSFSFSATTSKILAHLETIVMLN